jgi:hypothetical protein
MFNGSEIQDPPTTIPVVFSLPSSHLECRCNHAFFNLCTVVLLGGLGAGLLDFSLSAVPGFALAGVPGALGAGLGAVDGAGLGMGAGLGAALTGVGFNEDTLPVLAGLTEPSPLAVLGAGLTAAVTIRCSCIV